MRTRLFFLLATFLVTPMLATSAQAEIGPSTSSPKAWTILERSSQSYTTVTAELFGCWGLNEVVVFTGSGVQTKNVVRHDKTGEIRTVWSDEFRGSGTDSSGARLDLSRVNEWRGWGGDTTASADKWDQTYRDQIKLDGRGRAKVINVYRDGSQQPVHQRFTARCD